MRQHHVEVLRALVAAQVALIEYVSCNVQDADASAGYLSELKTCLKEADSRFRAMVKAD